MPKDTTQEDGGQGESSKNVLSRGAACLYCRKRRIRCSAAKPTCDNCKKLQRECVYDSGKPVSRVKQLEEKVAELEQLLGGVSGGDSGIRGRGQGQESRKGSAGGGMSGQGNSLPNNTSSSSTDSSPPNFNFGLNGGGMDYTPQYSTSTQNTPPMMDFMNLGAGAGAFNPFLGGIGVDMLGGANGTDVIQAGSSNRQPAFTSVFPQYSSLDVPIEDTFDFSMLNPNFMNLVNSFGETMVAPTSNPFDVSPQQQQQAAVPPSNSSVPGRTSMPQSRVNCDESMDMSEDANIFEMYTNPQVGSFPPTPAGPVQSNGTENGSGLPFPMSKPSYDGSAASSSSNPFPSTQSYGTTSISHPSQTSGPCTSASSTTQSNCAPQSNSSFSPAWLSDKTIEQFSGCIDPQLNAIGLNDTYDDAPKQTETKRTRTFGLAMSSRDNGLENDRSDPSLDGLPLVGGWFDAADLPTVARDHLLDIFFSGMKVVGQEIHIPRFLASSTYSLSLPPLKRPHPCLLYTMYLLASRASTHQPIRALESHFYSIALRQLEEAVAHADRLLDATRAATMLAVYKYGLAKYHEGYMMTGMAARLAVSSGLHQIPSCVFKASRYAYDRRADLGALMRQRAYILGPPADAIDLGERIWAFWAVYTVDRCGAIASQWPCAIPDEIICTPFPKPLHEFELGLVSEHDDISITSNWLPDPPLPYPTSSAEYSKAYQPRTKSSMMTLYIRGLSVLERASKLMYLPPEAGWDVGLDSEGSAGVGWGASPGGGIDDFLRAQNVLGGGMAPGGGTRNGNGSGRNGTAGASDRGWTKTPKIRVPKAYAEVRQALLRIESDLPEERRTNWEVWDGKMFEWHFLPGRKKEAVTLHFVIGCAWMFLFDVYSFTSENKLAVNVARRLTGTIKYVVQEDEYAEMDVFIAMVFSFLVKILIREVKRLYMIGDHEGAKPLEGEIEIVVQALKRVGQRYNVASMQAMRADRYRKSTDSETDFLKTDDV